MAWLVHRLISLAVCAGFFLIFFAGSWSDIFRSGPELAERAYTAEKYEKALELYQEAQTRNPDSDTLAYNLGNTLYKLGRFEDAGGQYGKILEKESPALTPRAVYNMGNTLFQMGRQTQNQEFLKQALEAYKHSIVLDPDDEDPKYNYELTRRLLKEQQQQQQNNRQSRDDKKDDKQQQNQQNQQQQDQEKKKESQQQQQQQQEKEQQQQAQQQPAKMSKEEAERILNALMRMEKEMQQKEKDKKRAVTRSRGPDW